MEDQLKREDLGYLRLISGNSEANEIIWLDRPLLQIAERELMPLADPSFGAVSNHQWDCTGPLKVTFQFNQRGKTWNVTNYGMIGIEINDEFIAFGRCRTLFHGDTISFFPSSFKFAKYQLCREDHLSCNGTSIVSKTPHSNFLAKYWNRLTEKRGNMGNSANFYWSDLENLDAAIMSSIQDSSDEQSINWGPLDDDLELYNTIEENETPPASRLCSRYHCGAAADNEPIQFSNIGNHLPKMAASQDYNLNLILAASLPQYAGTKCTFYLDISCSEKKLVHIDSLDIFLIGPSGKRYSVHIPVVIPEETLQCLFEPVEFGMHVVVAMITDLDFPNCQANLTINISRNYCVLPSSSILSFNIEPRAEANQMMHRKPWGICCNTRTEEILIADQYYDEVLVYGRDGKFHYTIGYTENGARMFCRPTGIAYDSVRDRILIVDKDHHRIQIVSPQGQLIKSFGSFGRRNGEFKFPWGIAVSIDGQVIAVSDSRNHRIQLFDADCNFIRMHNGSQDSSGRLLRYPRGITFDLTGENLYMTDYTLHTVYKLDVGFRAYTLLLDDTILKRPSGVAIDKAGNLLICDSDHHSLKVFDPSTGLLTQDIGRLGDSEQLNIPLNVAVLQDGSSAILDSNGRVRVV